MSGVVCRVKGLGLRVGSRIGYASVSVYRGVRTMQELCRRYGVGFRV